MHVLATREAVERFALELPLGPQGDRLRRTAEALRQLYDQALSSATRNDIVLAWADHNLGVLVAECFQAAADRADPGSEHLTNAGLTLYLGVRRRLVETLTNEPDDLAVALGLALGSAATLTDRNDQRLAEDISALTRALGRPGAGPKLATAATRALVQAVHRAPPGRGEGDKSEEKSEKPGKGDKKDAGNDRKDEFRQAAAHLAVALREAVERLHRRLPEHPDLALDRIRLVLLAARGSDGPARAEALASARGLLADHEARFGASEAQREVTSTLIQLRTREAPPAELARDVVTLLEIDQRERQLDPRRSLRLVRSLQRANALDAETARKLQRILRNDRDPGEVSPAQGEVQALLLEALGDEAALVSLQEKQLERDPKDHAAAKTLFERLLKNVRKGLASPFAATTVDLVTQGIQPAALARLSADDVDALLALLRETFGLERALAFAKNKLTQTRELKQREFVWKRALALATEANDEAAVVDIARRSLGEKAAPPEARLVLARALVASGQDLDEADDLLRPLTAERGPLAAEAQQLKAKIKADPRFREARYKSLLAFEDQLGVGTPRPHVLKVVFTAPGYVLAELVERPAPEFYENKHLRVMLRGEDLPQGTKPSDLKKGDELRGPVRGQDASHERDKEGLRIYWIADAREVRLALSADAIATRLREEEAIFGIGSGRPVPLKVAWDGKKKRLVARLFEAQPRDGAGRPAKDPGARGASGRANNDGGREFRVRPHVEVDQLPDGVEPAQVGGRGRRFLGTVERHGASEYIVTGKLIAASAAEPAEAPPESDETPIGTAEAAPETHAVETATEPTA